MGGGARLAAAAALPYLAVTILGLTSASEAADEDEERRRLRDDF